MSKNKAIGVVYSTNPDYQYQYADEPEAETLPPAKQRLRVTLDRHHRGGKTVTLVTGFVGTDDSSLVERVGGIVSFVTGPRDNIKVTVPEDFGPAEAALLTRLQKRNGF